MFELVKFRKNTFEHCEHSLHCYCIVHSLLIIFNMASASTRSSTEHSILGQPKAFRKNQLPTSADVFRTYDFYLKTSTLSTAHERATLVAQEVKEIYHAASIPTATVSSIVIR